MHGRGHGGAGHLRVFADVVDHVVGREALRAHADGVILHLGRRRVAPLRDAIHNSSHSFKGGKGLNNLVSFGPPSRRRARRHARRAGRGEPRTQAKIRRGFSKNNMRGVFFEPRGRFLLRPAALWQGAAGPGAGGARW